MKKKLLLLLMAAMTCAALLAGCGGGDGDSKDGDSKTEGEDKSATKISKFEKEGVTLEWMVFGTMPEEYYQHYFEEMKGFQKIEEETGINIEFQIQTATDNYLPIMTAATFPDLVTAYHLSDYSGRLDKLYLDGISIAMDPYIDKYMPNFKAILEEYPQLSKDLQISSGEYTFASTLYDVNSEEDRMAKSVGGLAIRKDWLDAVGLDVPTTMDEWFDVLMEFKSKDPNANGEMDETPMCMAASAWKRFLVAYGIGDDPVVDKDGKVFYGYATPEYKDFLTEMNKWYNEGLFKNWFELRSTQERDKVVTQNIAGAWLADAPNFDENDATSYISVLRQSVPNAEFAACPYPTTADGEQYCYTDIASFDRLTTIITSNCKEKEAACWFLDAMYSDEGSDLLSWGIEGESYEVVNGEKQLMEGMDETIDYYGTPIQKSYTYADPTTTVFPKFKSFASCILSTQSEDYINACKTWAQGDINFKMPYPAQLNDALSAEIADIEDSMKNEIGKWRQDFVEGKEPLTNYDTYIEQIKLKGSDKFEQVWQECYDAYKARKAYGEK